jgi:hypothetical protein
MTFWRWNKYIKKIIFLYVYIFDEGHIINYHGTLFDLKELLKRIDLTFETLKQSSGFLSIQR